MKISVVLTCYNEERNIRECLDALISQIYPADKYEIVVVDGVSQDKTQDIIKEFAKNHSNISLIIEHKRGTAAGRNAGIKGSTYDYVAFIDADCIAPLDWLNTLVAGYISARKVNKDVVAVGGSNFPKGESSSFIQAIGIALDSYLGSFSSIQGRQFKMPTYVSSVSTANSLYDKNKITEIGCFDESLKSEAEDADMNYRLYSVGYKFLFIPDSFVWHKMRSTPILWMKNMFRYGKGRARLLKRYPNMWSFSFLMPVFFIISMAVVPAGIFFKILFLPLLYFPLVLIFAIYQCKIKKALHLFFAVICVYIIQHFAYASGEVYGLINPKVK